MWQFTNRNETDENDEQNTVHWMFCQRQSPYELWILTDNDNKNNSNKKNNHTSWLHLAQLNKKKATTTNSTTVKYHLNQINLSISVNKQLQRTNIDSVGMLLLIWEKKKKYAADFINTWITVTASTMIALKIQTEYFPWIAVSIEALSKTTAVYTHF